MPAHELLQGVRVAPSILASDFARLGEQVESVMDAGATLFVAGSSIFGASDPAAAYGEIVASAGAV